MSKKLIIHTDGGARGNPGPAGIGVVVDDGTKKHHYKKYIGETTNNQAEYQAVYLALEKAHELKGEELEFYLDSELVVKQLNWEYKVKDKGLAVWFVKIVGKIPQFKKVTFKHVFREKNKEADLLVNQAIDERK
jgi:ribonuclease HI